MLGKWALPSVVARGNGRDTIWKAGGSQNTVHATWLESGQLLLPVCSPSFLVNRSHMPSKGCLVFASSTLGKNANSNANSDPNS